MKQKMSTEINSTKMRCDLKIKIFYKIFKYSRIIRFKSLTTEENNMI